jgi:hypothetical protein
MRSEPAYAEADFGSAQAGYPALDPFWILFLIKQKKYQPAPAYRQAGGLRAVLRWS